MVDHEYASDRMCEVGSKVLLQHMERQVDPRAVACRCPDRSIDDEDAIAVQSDLGEACLQFVGEEPVCSDAAIVEKARVCQREDASADGGNPARRFCRV